MTSAAINALIEVSSACRGVGGRLVIFGLQRPLRKVFADTGLDRILTVAADADAALRLFNPRPRWSLFRRAA
jgi:anti-anti-sigma factor